LKESALPLVFVAALQRSFPVAGPDDPALKLGHE
jgi:hypothetical protein